MSISRFNIRVYGIMVNEEDNILLADEIIKGRKITKFPGGGLEFGEGKHDCLKRECKEELGIDVAILSHFYTTDFFQPSAFDDDNQIISIYYRIYNPMWHLIAVKKKRFDFDEPSEGAFVFRWKPLDKLSEEDLTFDIDKKVAKMLRDELKV